MKKILTNLLLTFFTFNLTLGATINEDDKEIKIKLDSKKNISMLVDNLAGTWQLQRAIRYKSGDTIIQEPSFQLWLTPGAKSFTTIKIDSLLNFVIEQECMKCPYLFWKGKCKIDIRIFKELEFYYLTFIDNRVIGLKGRNRKKAFTLDFNGFITNLESENLSLTDIDGTEWIYKRQ